MKRRDFIANSAVLGTAAVFGGANLIFANENEATKETKMANLVPNYLLNNGIKIPILGLGSWDIRGSSGQKAIETALQIGYRHIDTAQYYRNEEIVGNAVRNSGIPRSEIFVTSKLQWGANVGKDGAKRAFEQSLKELKFDYIDLYLIHAPYGDIDGIWSGFCELVEQGVVKSIGISNFSVSQTKALCDKFSIKPALNQIEIHPFNQQIVAQKGLDELGVATQSYSPFGQGSARILNNETLRKIGEKYDKTAAQVVLRWLVQRNIIIIPKSANEKRLRENYEIFDFALSNDDMKEIANLR